MQQRIRRNVLDVSRRCMLTRDRSWIRYLPAISLQQLAFKFTTTGDTICDDQHPVILESMEFPEPVIELAIEPKTKAGQGKLGEALPNWQKKT